jgi:squalene cyclase
MKEANAPRKANAWIDQHVQADATWYGNALVVEHRYAWALVVGMNDAGLTIA